MENINNWTWEEKEDGSVEIDIGRLIVDKEDLNLILENVWRINITTRNNGKKINIHRFILQNNISDNLSIDHINCNELDNRKCNLRKCNQSENNRNKRKRKNTKYKYKGIRKIGDKWGSKIKYLNKEYYIGTFDSQEDAALAYDKKAIELHGEFASLNFPKIGQEKYEQKLTWEENEDGSVSIDFGKLIIDKEDTLLIINKKWDIRFYFKKDCLLYRIIINCPKNKVIDHIDCNPLNNRKKNLRICTIKENNYNIKSYGDTSIYKGVHFSKKRNKFISQISENNKTIRLGEYNDEIYAAKIYDCFARYLHGDFAVLNFPDEKLYIDCEKYIKEKNNRKYHSKYIGVSFDKSRNYWFSFIMIKQKFKYLGRYNNEEDAAIAYNKEAIKLNKKLNIIED